MSGTGFYRIYSSLHDNIIHDNPPIGAIRPSVAPPGFSEPIRTRVGAPWKLLQLLQGDIENNYEFSIVNNFSEVVAFGDVITATSDVAKNEVWNLRYVKESDAFVISSVENKDLVWTASDSASDTEIRLKPLLLTAKDDVFVSPSQSFKFYKLLEAANA